MSNRAPSMITVHPSVDPLGGIYPAEIDRLKNKIKLGDRISVICKHKSGQYKTRDCTPAGNRDCKA